MDDGFGCMCQGIRALLILGMLVGALVGCGYTLVGAPSDAPGKRLPLNILPFTNQTREPDLERITTAALRRTIVQSQMFVFAADGASVTRLQGTIRRFISYPLALNSQDIVVEYRIDAAIYIRLIEASTQQPLLEQEISSSAVYLVSRSSTDKVREDVAAREAALARLAQQFADKCLALLAITLL
jgi:LPS O-antigen subunit length determinant protein (WzzB/FepE family)